MTQPVATAPADKSPETIMLSIGFLMDMIEKVKWPCAGGRGPWEACLAALVMTLEPGCKSRRLIDALPAAGAGMDSVDTLNTMANLGYYSQSISVCLRDIEPRLIPCLFVPAGEKSTPCAVLSCEKGVYTVYDSKAHKVQTLTAGNAQAAVQGKAFFFSAYDAQRQQTSKFMRQGSGQSWFGALVRRFDGTFRQILATCLALNIFALAPALFIMMAYDRVISPSDPSAMPALAVGVALALAAEYALRGVRSQGLAWMTARMDYIVGSRIFAQMIGLPAALIEQASVAAQIARIKTFESVRDFFSSAVFLSFLEIPFVLIALGVMAAIAGPLVLVPVSMIAGYFLIFSLMRRRIKVSIRLAAKSSSAKQQFTIETLEKLRGIRANGLTAAWEDRYARLSGREILMNFQLGFLGTVAETLAHALTVIAAVLTIGFGVGMIWSGAMSTGALVASMILVWRILLPFYSLCTMIPRLEQLRNSILQVNQLMDLETEADMATTAAALPALRGDISAEGVAFGYDEAEDPIINGLTFNLKHGQIAAITGRNGSGKTSVLKLLKALYRPQHGALRIDGYDLRQMQPRELRRQIAYVPQTADFFPGSIAENLLIGNPFATDDDIRNALKLAAALEDVERLPQGIETPVIESSLSDTLTARLSLARAYLQNADVLLIDELPNAVLNGPAGRNLKNYLEQSRGRRTALVVTHRRDFMDIADIIISMERGQEPSCGPREEMIERMKEAA